MAQDRGAEVGALYCLGKDRGKVRKSAPLDEAAVGRKEALRGPSQDKKVHCSAKLFVLQNAGRVKEG